MANYEFFKTEYKFRGKHEMTQEQAVKKAFRGAETKEEFETYQEMFDCYVRGGVEELYERLVIRKADSDDAFYENKTANLMALLKRFVPDEALYK